MVAFTTEDLLAASDDSDCGAGPVGDSRHICIHIVPLLVELTLLLFNGLAEHFLVELAVQWKHEDDNNLSDEQKGIMLSALQLLVAASGASWKEEGAGAEAILGTTTAKVSELLTSFMVGTERCKSRTLGAPPDPSEMKPFREYKVVNPAQRMKQRTNRLGNSDNASGGDESTNEQDSGTEQPTGVVPNKPPEIEVNNLAMQSAVEALGKVLNVTTDDLLMVLLDTDYCSTVHALFPSTRIHGCN